MSGSISPIFIDTASTRLYTLALTDLCLSSAQTSSSLITLTFLSHLHRRQPLHSSPFPAFHTFIADTLFTPPPSRAPSPSSQTPSSLLHLPGLLHLHRGPPLHPSTSPSSFTFIADNLFTPPDLQITRPTSSHTPIPYAVFFLPTNIPTAPPPHSHLLSHS